jgi:hypothetical protein
MRLQEQYKLVAKNIMGKTNNQWNLLQN